MLQPKCNFFPVKFLVPNLLWTSDHSISLPIDCTLKRVVSLLLSKFCQKTKKQQNTKTKKKKQFETTSKYCVLIA